MGMNQYSPSDPQSSPSSHANQRIRLGTKDEEEKDCSNQHGPGILVGGVSYLVREREAWGINQHLRGGGDEPGTGKNRHCRVYLW